MLLERDSVDAVLFVHDTGLFKDPIAAELLKELGAAGKSIGEDTKIILIRNGGERTAILDRLPGAGETAETEAGTLVGGETLTLDGMTLFPDSDADLCVSVLRGGAEIDRVDFSYVYDPARGVVSQLGTVHDNGTDKG